MQIRAVDAPSPTHIKYEVGDPLSPSRACSAQVPIRPPRRGKNDFCFPHRLAADEKQPATPTDSRTSLKVQPRSPILAQTSSGPLSTGIGALVETTRKLAVIKAMRALRRPPSRPPARPVT